jgi:hypothetical protein
MGLSVAFDRFSQFDGFIQLKKDIKNKKDPSKDQQRICILYFIHG